MNPRHRLYLVAASVLKSLPPGTWHSTDLYRLIGEGIRLVGGRAAAGVAGELVSLLADNPDNQDFIAGIVDTATQEELADLLQAQLDGPDGFLP